MIKTYPDYPKFGNSLVISKISGEGIKINTDSPAFGWRDITSDISVKGAGVNNPSWSAYVGSIYGYAFSGTASQVNEAWINFHIPHDYFPGSELFIHAHWSQLAVAGTTVKWYFDAIYAKGYAQQTFPSSVTTVSSSAQVSAAVRTHEISEIQLTTNGSLGGNTIEVDGILLVRVYRDAAQDTSTDVAYLHFCDLHYQSTNMATKNRNFDFYT